MTCPLIGEPVFDITIRMPVHDGGPGNLSPPTPVEHEIINKGHLICVTGSSVMFHYVYQIIKSSLKPFLKYLILFPL